MISRRALIAGGALALAGSASPARLVQAADKSFLPQGLPEGVYDAAALEALPGKKPLIKLVYRPPNYETPLSYFTSEFTPNDSFFVRYHLAGIPEEIDPAQWKLTVGGEGVARPLELTLSDLRANFDAVEVAAVCQCSGNRRGFSEPHVPGVQWGFGAVGNALWKGARLKDVLSRANVRPETVEVALNGADGPVLDGTPDFIKSIPLDKALDENTLIAYEMNGAPLPHYNGFPIRLVLPGWTATYWMKHLVSIEAVTKPFGGFWMKSAYRIPNGKFPIVQHFLSQMAVANEPITEMVINSMITAPAEGFTLHAGESADIRGVAWDGGYGIARVEISTGDRGALDRGHVGRGLPTGGRPSRRHSLRGRAAAADPGAEPRTGRIGRRTAGRRPRASRGGRQPGRTADASARELRPDLVGCPGPRRWSR